MISPWNKSETAGGEALHQIADQSTGFCRHSEKGQWYCYILLVLFSLTLPLGILGNIAVLINYTCFRHTSSASHVFLLNLALCDSAWILTHPFALYFAFHTQHIADVQVLCRVKQISFNVNIYSSIFFLTLISFDRYVGTVHPISSLRWWGVRKAKLCSMCTWLVVVLSSIPDLFITPGGQRSENITICVDHILGPFVYTKTTVLLRTTLGFLLPFGVMLVFYIMTLRVLRHLPKGRGNGGVQRAGGKPMRLVTAAILVFGVSFVPYHIMVLTLVAMRLHHQVTPSNASVIYACFELFEAMCSLSSCLDPLLYIVVAEQLKRKLLSLKRDHNRRRCCRASRRVGVADS